MADAIVSRTGNTKARVQSLMHMGRPVSATIASNAVTLNNYSMLAVTSHGADLQQINLTDSAEDTAGAIVLIIANDDFTVRDVGGGVSGNISLASGDINLKAGHTLMLVYYNGFFRGGLIATGIGGSGGVSGSGSGVSNIILRLGSYELVDLSNQLLTTQAGDARVSVLSEVSGYDGFYMASGDADADNNFQHDTFVGTIRFGTGGIPQNFGLRRIFRNTAASDWDVFYLSQVPIPAAYPGSETSYTKVPIDLGSGTWSGSLDVDVDPGINNSNLPYTIWGVYGLRPI